MSVAEGWKLIVVVDPARRSRKIHTATRSVRTLGAAKTLNVVGLAGGMYMLRFYLALSQNPPNAFY